ncbi:MAG: Translation elongation factor P [Candidatus Woesebacteria bacterium GW2011_GWC1_42_9]|nr:MAG: Translation elongation factor P [Candidatus Woesebacteria bacterium GW2011_GWC1_42_9]
MKKIEIFVRHCFYSPCEELANRGRPAWFSKEKAWENLLDTVDHDLANITVIYDRHFGHLNPAQYKPGENIVEIDSGNEAGSFLAMLDIIMQRNFDPETIIYLLEDDYIHREGWCTALVEGSHLAPYFTLYDHVDKYTNYPKLMSRILISPSAHWRTIPSTCNTYACKMSTLKEDIETHRFFSKNSNNGVSRDNDKFVELAKMGRVLISSMPGFSTQCDLFMSPLILWEIYGNPMIEGWLSPLEGAALREYAKDRVCLEIGSYKGRSANYMAQTAKILYCVDTFKADGQGQNQMQNFTSIKDFLFNIKKFNNIIPIIAKSSSVALLFASDSLDLVFIDGGHDYDSVISDIDSFFPKVRAGGLICFHDYGPNTGWDGVMIAVTERFGTPNAIHDHLAVIIKK